ncbi:amino acid/polyamine transporter I, partial [Mycena sp. CBHHK59/15]
RQSYAFSRDGALPFSRWLYRMNSFTRTPVNTVVFDAFFSLILGLLVFAGPQAINAVFAISVTALYIAYAIPIVARFAGNNDFKLGPFNLGVFSLPVAVVSVLFMLFLGIAFLFPTSPQTDVADMNYTIVVLGGVLFLSVVWYYLSVVGGVHWFKGPVATV